MLLIFSFHRNWHIQPPKCKLNWKRQRKRKQKVFFLLFEFSLLTSFCINKYKTSDIHLRMLFVGGGNVGVLSHSLYFFFFHFFFLGTILFIGRYTFWWASRDISWFLNRTQYWKRWIRREILCKKWYKNEMNGFKFCVCRENW